jgi:hypothetical protein
MSDDILTELKADWMECACYENSLSVDREVIDRAAAEIERLCARVAVLEDLAGYFAGRNADNVSVVLWGNPDACGKLIERARIALLEAQP